jgi:hypothetical protein
MHIRRISNALFRRNRPFWLRRLKILREEIRLTRMRRVIGILNGWRPHY